MIIYPSITDIKTAIEKFLDITPQEKCFNLKSLKIQKGESIKDFNWRYGKLYGSLTPESQAFITINDYTDSLLSRPYARKEVITSQPLEEAFKIAELAETASEMPNRNRNVVMFTNTYWGLNSIFPNNYNNYNNRNYNNPNTYDYNNYRSNYNYYNNNNYNKKNSYNHSNNYNNNYRNSYNNYYNSINNRKINHFRNGYNSGNNYNNNNPNFVKNKFINIRQTLY